MQLGSQVGANVCEALESSRKALRGSMSWVRPGAFELEGAALVAATGGLALVAVPGADAAAAVTSALAAFGPGEMIGGVLTAGTLVSAGTGSIRAGLATSGTTADVAEAVVAAQLAAAVLRSLQGLDQDPSLWGDLLDARAALERELARLEAVSDDSAPSLKQLQRKLDIIEEALELLRDRELAPTQIDTDAGAT
jgi:hypothetical protein